MIFKTCLKLRYQIIIINIMFVATWDVSSENSIYYFYSLLQIIKTFYRSSAKLFPSMRNWIETQPWIYKWILAQQHGCLCHTSTLIESPMYNVLFFMSQLKRFIKACAKIKARTHFIQVRLSKDFSLPFQSSVSFCGNKIKHFTLH